ncbi:MAG: leucyl aminopeptidase family protein, partial [Symploca sp. SIO2B6]|nr:leucyl aminopeptidase family protein [Symploca sp. SIO2B6]
MSDSTPIIFVDPDHLKSEYTTDALWLEACQFTGKAGSHCLLPDANQGITAVLVGKPDEFDVWTLGQ